MNNPNKRRNPKRSFAVEFLTEWRESKLISQQELSALAGVSTQTLSKLENGGSSTITTIAKICQALHISREELVFNSPAPRE